MECMKCGRETREDAVFCEACLKEMDQYPVQTSTPVVIPKREEFRRKAPVKKAPKPEEQIEGLNRTIRRLRRWVCFLSVLSALTSAALGYMIWSHWDDQELGSNYSTVINSGEENGH